jgi:ABC-2 type transport system ATP-binding protein
MENLLVVDSVSKTFVNHKALNNVSISIPKESIFGLLGPNGAGKTTLIRIINQIIIPDSGNVFLDNQLLEPKHISDIGYLPEERGLYPKMKVGEQALYLAQLKGMTKLDAKKQLKYWFEKFDIGEWWNKKAVELSKGMAQKVQFIVTVLHRPKLLIFDEPFSGFDPINANLIKDEILNLRNEGATVIFSTHRMESVEELCDNIALINKSNKILDGKLDEIKREYQTNTFEVGLITNRKSETEKEIKNNFHTSKPTFKGLGDNLRLNILLKESQTSDELLSFLVKKAKIQHFKEVIPSANDIFIKSVKEN